jgi:hypothetical protein
MDIAKRMSGLASLLKEKRLVVLIALIVCIVSVTIAMAVLSGNGGFGASGAPGQTSDAATSGGTEYTASADITIAMPE